MADDKKKPMGTFSKYGVSAPYENPGVFVYGVNTPAEPVPDLEIRPFVDPNPQFVEVKPAAFELLADERARVAALRAAIKFAVKCLSTDAETATPVVEALKQVLEDTK